MFTHFADCGAIKTAVLSWVPGKRAHSHTDTPGHAYPPLHSPAYLESPAVAVVGAVPLRPGGQSVPNVFRVS